MISVEFSKLIRILVFAFRGNSISEEQYHKIIELMRSMNINGKYTTLDDEHKIFMKNVYGIQEGYNPFDFMEKLRYAFSFGEASNKIDDEIYKINTKQFNIRDLL